MEEIYSTSFGKETASGRRTVLSKVSLGLAGTQNSICPDDVCQDTLKCDAARSKDTKTRSSALVKGKENVGLFYFKCKS